MPGELAASGAGDEVRAPTALYVDAEFAPDYRDAARKVLDGAGFQWLPAWQGATSQVARSSLDPGLSREAYGADLVVLRFGPKPLEEHWAFGELARLKANAGRLIVVLDAEQHFAKRRLDEALGFPSFLIEGVTGLEAALRAAIPTARPPSPGAASP